MDPRQISPGDRVHAGWLGGTVRKVALRRGRWMVKVKFDLDPEPQWVLANELESYGKATPGRAMVRGESPRRAVIGLHETARPGEAEGGDT